MLLLTKIYATAWHLLLLRMKWVDLYDLEQESEFRFPAKTAGTKNVIPSTYILN